MTPGASMVLEGDCCLLVGGRSRSLGYYPVPALRKPNGPVIGFVAVGFN